MNILAIDPGFDTTGWAVFRCRPDQLPQTLNHALGLLHATGEICTSTADPDHVRLASLAQQMKNLLEAYFPVLVYLERPAYAGDYGGRRARRAEVNKLYMAIGALQAVIRGPQLFTVPAIRTPKDTRHQLLSHAAQVSRVSLPEGPRGGARQDQLDAIWLGCQALLERVAGDLRVFSPEVPAFLA